MDEDDQSWKRPINLSIISGGKKLPTATSQGQQAQERASWISTQARQVLGSYRRDDFADPETFLIQLGRVLEGYADEIVVYACRNIIRQSKFPPSIAEIVAVCDTELERVDRIRRYQTVDQGSLRDREQIAELDRQEPLEYRKAVVARLWPRASEDAKRSIPDSKFKQYTDDELRAMYGKPEAADAS